MYQQQLQRLERKYDSLTQAKDTISDATIDEIKDLLLSFFQDCWHLKDWLTNSTKTDKWQLHTFLSNSLEMNMCREICNTSKHLVLTRPAQVSNARLANFRDIGVPLALAREYAPGADKLTFIFQEHYYDAFELAGKCLALWHEFLRSIV